MIIIDSVSRGYFKTFYGASGILISNIYLKIYTIILGSIPSHSDEFHSFYSQFSDDISVKDFDNTISKIKINQTFDLNLPKFEDFYIKMKYDFLILGFGEVSSGWTNPQWMAYTLSKEKNSVAYFNPPAYKQVKLGHIQRLFQRLFLTNKKYSDFKIYNSYLNDHPFLE